MGPALDALGELSNNPDLLPVKAEDRLCPIRRCKSRPQVRAVLARGIIRGYLLQSPCYYMSNPRTTTDQQGANLRMCQYPSLNPY